MRGKSCISRGVLGWVVCSEGVRFGGTGEDDAVLVDWGLQQKLKLQQGE